MLEEDQKKPGPVGSSKNFTGNGVAMTAFLSLFWGHSLSIMPKPLRTQMLCLRQ